ncbi:hypothetical protein KHP62_18235 [Rhodobacteraceae bacterium NNCM2]|nr:hypothetical protein [Coraliihabitans acroporae]
MLRPEAVSTVLRWAEPVVTGLATLWLGKVAFSLLWLGNPIGFLAAVGAALSATWCAVSTFRNLLSGQGASQYPGGPGIVSLDEGRIGYFGPHGGGFIAVDALVAVDLLSGKRRAREELLWRFTDEAGEQLIVPNGAEGAEHLLDTLGVLPKLDYPKIIAAMFARGDAVYPIWRRDAARIS